MAEGEPFVGVAITGTPDPPTGYDVLLPWQAQGRSRRVWAGQMPPSVAGSSHSPPLTSLMPSDTPRPSPCEELRRPSDATEGYNLLGMRGVAIQTAV